MFGVGVHVTSSKRTAVLSSSTILPTLTPVLFSSRGFLIPWSVFPNPGDGNGHDDGGVVVVVMMRALK